MAIEDQLGLKINLVIKHIQDFRNYKVSVEKAANILSFHPHDDVNSIVGNLIANKSKFADWDNAFYYNIQRLKELEAVWAEKTMMTTVPAIVVRNRNSARTRSA